MDWTAENTGEIVWAPDLESATAAFRRAVRRIGIESYAYAHLGTPAEYNYIDTTYPDSWMGHYLAERYFDFDPVVVNAFKTPLPFAWRFLTNRADITLRQRILFRDAADHGLRDGLTVPFHSHGTCAGLLSFAFDSAERMKAILAELPTLRLAGLYYHAAVERLQEEQAEECDLTAFERKCITWTAAGRSRWDISATLHCPEGDVAHALRSVREKLGTATIAQAVTKAISQGLVIP